MEDLHSILYIAKLIAKEKTEELTNSEKTILQNWLAENDNNKNLYEKLQTGELLLQQLEELKMYDTAKAFRKVDKSISKNKPLIPTFIKYAAAILAIAVSFYFLRSLIYNNENQLAQSSIVPGKQAAILITGSQQRIYLDSAKAEKIIANQIIQSGSTLSYEAVDTATDTKEYNTLITPRGAEYTIVLSDGTEVLINAESELKYPVVFNTNIREVELVGEAFFKVARNNHKPFIVKVNDMSITVYGTTFNVSAYSNENLVQTTLIEGSVGVGLSNSPEQKIKPGQQFIYIRNSGTHEIKSVDVEKYVAWTKEMFVFENEPIENILRTMSRWYNFDYEFQSDVLKNQRFTVSIHRYENVSKILDMITLSSKVKFSVKGNSILVY